jgi:aminopeptidase-like protein
MSPKGEPQLGRRGLYPGMGGGEAGVEQRAMLWLLNQSDGTASVLDIAERSSIPFPILVGCAERLEEAGLLVEKEEGVPR